MCVLKRFLKDERGSAPLWVAFCLLIFFMLGSLLYNVHAIYSQYYAVQDELTRCAAITLDANVANAKLRDTMTDVEYQAALDVFEANLLSKGWAQEGTGWTQGKNGRADCRLTDMRVSVAGSNLHLSATVNIPLPWAVNGTTVVRFPLDLYARILYIN